MAICYLGKAFIELNCGCLDKAFIALNWCCCFWNDSVRSLWYWQRKKQQDIKNKKIVDKLIKDDTKIKDGTNKPVDELKEKKTDAVEEHKDDSAVEEHKSHEVTNPLVMDHDIENQVEALEDSAQMKVVGDLVNPDGCDLTEVQD